MITLQELISRGRFIFQGAPKRLEIFKLIDGKRSAKEIAIKVGRSHSSVLNDIKKLKDMELIKEKIVNGKILKKDGSTVFEKNPIIRHVPYTYFSDVANTTIFLKEEKRKKEKPPKYRRLHIPNEKMILDICKHGEDQLYEFKSPGIDTQKITKEIAAFLHTRNGGIIFYGIDDDGSIIGSDIRRQDFDQKIQNSIRNSISPSPTIEIKEKKVIDHSIILIVIPPWDRKTLYQYNDRRYYIRKGTNVFALKPDEIKKLARGEYII
ncbi:hypothetical protein DRO49_01025 [Candidatus Bathyarchaeota archaeon]|nr:MAG: hypothetical protein DRO49_01025 [Candidatus Bathyarchaeota archaeon]